MAINQLILDVDKEVLQASKALYRAKYFVKWTIPVRKQVKQYYITNLVMK